MQSSEKEGAICFGRRGAQVNFPIQLVTGLLLSFSFLQNLLVDKKSGDCWKDFWLVVAL